MPEATIPLPEIEKTDLMRLVEALSGRDVREVVWELHQETGSYAGVARGLSKMLGRDVTRATAQMWCLNWFGWEDGLRIPEPQEPAAA